MGKLKVVSMDWDSTIADTRPRHHLIDRENGTDWDAYGLACHLDGIGPAFGMARYLTDSELPWIIVSGRAEVARAIGNDWLRKHNLRPWHVYLCDDRHDYMSHGEWKSTRLLEIQDQLQCEISLHVDDIKDVKEWNEKVGIPTMLTHDLWAPIEDHLG